MRCRAFAAGFFPLKRRGRGFRPGLIDLLTATSTAVAVKDAFPCEPVVKWRHGYEHRNRGPTEPRADIDVATYTREQPRNRG